MRIRQAPSLFVLLTLAALPAFAADDPPSSRLTEEERAELLQLFDESEILFFRLLAGVNDAQWSFKPAPERWSVGECAEHILRSNESLYGAAETALAHEADPEWYEKTKGKSEFLKMVMPNRNPGGAGGASAPQEIRPTGEISRGEILERFTALYEKARTYVSNTREPLKEHVEAHPFPIFDPLNAHNWLIYIPLHTIRHSKQMIEVMETQGYPGA